MKQLEKKKTKLIALRIGGGGRITRWISFKRSQSRTKTCGIKTT